MNFGNRRVYYDTGYSNWASTEMVRDLVKTCNWKCKNWKLSGIVWWLMLEKHGMVVDVRETQVNNNYTSLKTGLASSRVTKSVALLHLMKVLYIKFDCRYFLKFSSLQNHQWTTAQIWYRRIINLKYSFVKHPTSQYCVLFVYCSYIFILEHFVTF